MPTGRVTGGALGPKGDRLRLATGTTALPKSVETVCVGSADRLRPSAAASDGEMSVVSNMLLRISEPVADVPVARFVRPTFRLKPPSKAVTPAGTSRAGVGTSAADSAPTGCPAALIGTGGARARNVA